MHWCLFFGFILFTTALCNVDSGPAQVIALYLLRKYEEDSGVKSFQIAPKCPPPCGFKEFVQYVSPYSKNSRRPKYNIANWEKLGDDGLLNEKEAIAELQRIKFYGNIRDKLVFANQHAEWHYETVMTECKLAINNAKVARSKAGHSSVSGLFNLMLDYWKVVGNARRKNLADHIVQEFPKAFKKRFGDLELTPTLTDDSISRPPIAPYKQINLDATIAAAKDAYPSLPGQDLQDFIKMFPENYNAGAGKSHADAITDTDDFLFCNRA